MLVLVEEELVRLRERVVRLTTENHELQATIEKGDSRSGIILQQVQVMQRNDTDVVKEFRKLQSETLPKFNVSFLTLKALLVVAVKFTFILPVRCYCSNTEID